MSNDPRAYFLKQAAALEAWMLPFFQKAPHLPQNARQTLVDVAPWLALAGGILGLVGIFSTGAFTSLLFTLSFFRLGIFPLLFTIGLLLALVSAVLDLLAYQPLVQHKKAGWNLLFYGMILSVVSLLLHVISGYGVFGQLVGVLVGFWLLFEVRDAYKA